MSWRSEAHRPEHADEQNERMAALVQRDADEQERVDLLLDWRDRDLPIFAARAWANRPAPGSDARPALTQHGLALAAVPAGASPDPAGLSSHLRSGNPEQGGRDAR